VRTLTGRLSRGRPFALQCASPPVPWGMGEAKRARLAGLAILLAVVALPWLGAALADAAGWPRTYARSLSEYFQFPPPREIPTGYPRFSWLMAGVVVLPLVAIARSWRRALVRQRAPATANAMTPVADIWWPGVPGNPAVRRPFPGWGWLALGWTAAWWGLAWTRFPWFDAMQRYTFFPLWLGLIVSANALTFRRAGTCLMLRSPGRWLALFAASAGFWWVFEWLNRFVRNWHYLGVEGAGTVEYALHATLSFSTVLPALAAVSEWLATHPGWIRRCAAGPEWRWAGRRTTGAALLAGGALALGGSGIWPHPLYPALWVGPLALLWGESLLARRPNIGAEVAGGDWRRAATWMVAALICGLLWELWNWHSAARWIYTVPYADRWHVFEMPLLGYAGYLPFGLEALLVVDRLFPRR
jgi:hypothetical protein